MSILHIVNADGVHCTSIGCRRSSQLGRQNGDGRDSASARSMLLDAPFQPALLRLESHPTFRDAFACCHFDVRKRVVHDRTMRSHFNRLSLANLGILSSPSHDLSLLFPTWLRWRLRNMMLCAIKQRILFRLLWLRISEWIVRNSICCRGRLLLRSRFDG